MAKFELITKYEGDLVLLPTRKTAGSAGYDFVVAEETLIPPYIFLFNEMVKYADPEDPRTLDEMASITKGADAKPTLVPTGVKAKLDKGTYLELSVRSSCPLKHWLIMANSVGIIDAKHNWRR